MQQIFSRNPAGEPGSSHSAGAAIIWDEVNGGARPETVLRMVMERVQFLQSQLPCEENEHILEHLRQAIHWEELRNQRRSEQGVQGTHQPHVSQEGDPMQEPTPPDSNANPNHPPLNSEMAVDEHPNPLDIAMPLQDGRYLPQTVLASIEAQNIPYRLWTSTQFSNGEYAAARNHVKDLALQGKSPYILMTDNDLVFPAGAFEAMLMWLEGHSDFGAIALSKHAHPDDPQATEVVEPTHVDAGPVMFRREVYEQVQYSNDGGLCECQAMCNTLRDKLGVRIGFLSGFKVLHIHETRLA